MNFTREEFEFSETAERRKIRNVVPPELEANMRDTLAMMQRIRDHLCAVAGRDVPIIISSGYRCSVVNTLVGGSPASDHTRAEACDFRATAFGSPFEVATELAEHADALRLGQVAHEFGRWVHVSTRHPLKSANRIITISHAGTVPGIVRA